MIKRTFRERLSLVLALAMVFSTLLGILPMPDAAAQSAAPQLVTLTPDRGVSLEGTEGELSLTFDRPVAVEEGKQIQLLYDAEGDGRPDTPVLVQEEAKGDETSAPHDGMGGRQGEYTAVLSVDANNPAKVLVDLSYQGQSLLQKDHVYRLNVYDVIRSADGQAAFTVDIRYGNTQRSGVGGHHGRGQREAGREHLAGGRGEEPARQRPDREGRGVDQRRCVRGHGGRANRRGHRRFGRHGNHHGIGRLGESGKGDYR
jgi:hypothetical protein